MARYNSPVRSVASATLSILFILESFSFSGFGLIEPLVPVASAQAAPSSCLEKVSVQDQYAIVQAKNDIFFHRSVHQTNLNDWISVKDNQPWGATDINDVDMTEVPKGLANPTIPVALASVQDHVYIHYNLLDLATNNWQLLDNNKPWGTGVVTNVGISGNDNDATIRGVASVGSNAYFFSSANGSVNPYGSYTWANVTDNHPWGTAPIQDIDVTSDNRAMVLAGGLLYTHQSLLSLGGSDWVLAKQTISGGGTLTGVSRTDMEFRPAIASKSTDVYYIKYPAVASTTYNWMNIDDNKPWGNSIVDDVAVFFWTQAEPWQTPAIALIIANDVPYLHWHPDDVNTALAHGDWIDVRDNQPWNDAGGVCAVTGDTDLTITKTGPATVTRGSILTYSIAAHNNGPATAANVVVTDPVPTGFTFNPASSDPSCSLQGANVVCSIGTLTSGQTKNLALSFTVPTIAQCTVTTVTNTAVISSSSVDTDTQNNQSSFTTTLNCPVLTTDLFITKTGPASVTHGSTLSYSILVTNLGPNQATNVVVTDVIPALLTYNASLSDTSCAVVGPNVICNIGTLNSGQSRTLTIAFQTPALTNSCTLQTVQNVANVHSDVSDTNTANNQSALTTDLTCPVAADLSITKSGPATIVRGSAITYFLSVLNNGPSPATNVVLTDIIPAGVTFTTVGSDTSCAQQGNSVVCNLGTLTNGQSRSLNITFTTQQINACTDVGITNTATVTSGTADPVTTNNNSVMVQTTITCQNQSSCIDIVKETFDTNNNVLTPVAQFTFQLDNGQTVQTDSAGHARFNNVSAGSHTVTESIPSNWTQLSVTPANGVVSVNTGTTCSTVTFKNRQTITGGNNGNLSITKTDNRSTVTPGEDITYSITITNSFSTAQTITVTDVLPSLLSFISASDSGFLNGQTVTWNNLTINANSNRTITYQAHVSSSASNGAVISNTAQIVNGPSATDTTTVGTGGNNGGSLGISKTDNRSTVAAGEDLTYVITITNSFSTSQTFSITDVLPSQLTFLSASDSGFLNGQTVTWNNLTINPNASRTISYQARVSSSASNGSTISNTAQIVNGSSSTDTTTVGGTAGECDDFTVRVTDNPETVAPGEDITYTIKVQNDSDRDRKVDIHAFLDSQTDFRDASDKGDDISSREIRWRNVEIDSDDEERVTLKVRVDKDAEDGDSVRLRVTADCAEDTENTDVEENGSTTTTSNGDLSIEKQADRFEAAPGSEVNYTITVRNFRNSSVSNVSVEDTFIPQDVTFLDLGGGSLSSNHITWNIGTLGSSQSRVMQYRVRLNSALHNNDIVHNVAVLHGPTTLSSSVDVRIITSLPQTGADDLFSGPLENTTRFLFPFHSGSSEGGVPLASIIVTLLGLVSGGVVAGKKFLY